MWLVVKMHMSMAFIDFKRAFDNLNRNQMFYILRAVAEGECAKVANCVELIVSLLQSQKVNILGKKILI